MTQLIHFDSSLTEPSECCHCEEQTRTENSIWLIFNGRRFPFCLRCARSFNSEILMRSAQGKPHLSKPVSE
jgi:hypothetical protein